MDVQRIKTEGRRIDTPRNVNRIWLEVVAVTDNGATVQGHKINGVVPLDGGGFETQPTRIEVYADRLDAVLERVRTDKHREAWRQACELYQIQRAEWIAEHQGEYDKKPTKELKDEFVNRKYNNRPEVVLATALGYRTGIPPLDSCRVIHPQTGELMDAFEWKKLSPQDRKEWLVDAPATPMNQAERANEALANTLERLINRVSRK